MRGRPNSSTRLWTRECAVIDISKVSRCLPSYDWVQDPCLTSLYPDERPLPWVKVRANWPDGQELWPCLYVTTTKPYFGGVRWWFLCPECGRRVGKLYATEARREFACRVCWDLVYECQHRKHPLSVMMRRAKKWMAASPAWRRRWSERVANAWVSGKLTEEEAHALCNFSQRLPKGC